MATTSNAAVATGAEHGESLRRRNVATPQAAPQQIVQVEDKKKLQKKVRITPAAYMLPWMVATSSRGHLTNSFALLQEASFLQTLDEWEWLIAPIVFSFLAFFTRFYKIGLSPIVTWDEAQLVELASSGFLYCTDTICN